jgi:hypothetical protein
LIVDIPTVKKLLANDVPTTFQIRLSMKILYSTFLSQHHGRNYSENFSSVRSYIRENKTKSEEKIIKWFTGKQKIKIVRSIKNCAKREVLAFNLS